MRNWLALALKQTIKLYESNCLLHILLISICTVECVESMSNKSKKKKKRKTINTAHVAIQSFPCVMMPCICILKWTKNCLYFIQNGVLVIYRSHSWWWINWTWTVAVGIGHAQYLIFLFEAFKIFWELNVLLQHIGWTSPANRWFIRFIRIGTFKSVQTNPTKNYPSSYFTYQMIRLFITHKHTRTQNNRWK